MAQKNNLSSGAEKAEKLALANKSGKAKTTKEKNAPVKAEKKPAKTKKQVAKKTENKGKKNVVKHSKNRAEGAAKRRQKRQEHRMKMKENRQTRRTRLLEKRRELKAQRAERKAERRSESKQEKQARIAEERAAKREARAQKRKAYLAEKKAKREHELKVRAQRRAEKNDRRRSHGVGGWLAAVISLGVTTLALGTVVTFGWLNMSNMRADMAEGYTLSLYELNSIVDELDTDLAKAQASNSASDRVKVLSDIAIESRSAETVLERMPVDCQLTGQMSAFINKMGDSAREMLYTVANGGELSDSQLKTLEYMYESNKKLKEEMNQLVSSCENKDMLSAMRGKQSRISDAFDAIENSVFEQPEGIDGGAFGTVKKLSAAYVEGLEEITAQQAEKLAKEYFADYDVSGATCTGEAVAEMLTVYNVVLLNDDGEMFVQMSKNGGKVVAFDSYKDCSDRNFSVERCEQIACDFLEKIGYGRLESVWASESGTTCNLIFTPVENDAVLYTDKVLVKVCEERGIVTGMEALDYVAHHTERNIPEAQIDMSDACERINGNIEVYSVRKAVIPGNGGELLCYEIVGEMGENEYYIYVDAVTGEEVEVRTVVGTAQGRILK